MRYLMVVPAPLRRLGPHHFAIDGAFGEHLRIMMRALASRFTEMVIAAPSLDEATFEKVRGTFIEIDERKEPLRFVPLYEQGRSRARFWLRENPAALRTLSQLVASSDLVHSHLSHDLHHPVELEASLLARAHGKPLLIIADIDNRKSAEMSYRAGAWDFRTYAMCRYVYDPLRDLQQRALVRIANLVMFKEQQQVDDYGHGAAHVRYFQDPNFAESDVIPAAALDDKLRALRDPQTPLALCYFGRFVPYKGVAHMIDAVARARARGARVTFTIMGNGELEPALRAQVGAARLDDVVTWLPPRPYAELAAALRPLHLLLACPITPDTPRSAWDALASGLGLLAYDTPFYNSLARTTGAVELVPWLDVDALADRIVALDRDREKLARGVERGVACARTNPHDAWIERRVAWLFEMMDAHAQRRA